MELKILERDKKDTKKMSKFGNVPAVIYSKRMESRNIFLNDRELKNILSKLESGELSTLIFTLKNEKESFKAIVKDIQYFITSYNVSHVDFLALDDKTEVQGKVPIRCIGMAECVGIKQGGHLRQVIRSTKVKCLPKDLPKEFILDVAPLDVGGLLRLSDLQLSKGVKATAKSLKEVVVTIKK